MDDRIWTFFNSTFALDFLFKENKRKTVREIRPEYMHCGQTYLTASHTQLGYFCVIFFFFFFFFFKLVGWMAFYNGLLAGVHLIPSPSRAVSRPQLIPFPFPFERLPRRLQHAVHAEQNRVLTRFMKLDTPPALYDLAQPASVVHNYNTKDATNQNLCRPFSRTNYGLARLRWLDWIFWGWYLPTLSINYVGMVKDMEKKLPQRYYIKMKMSHDLGFIAIGVAMAT